jgi:hypothetical protein
VSILQGLLRLEMLGNSKFHPLHRVSNPRPSGMCRKCLHYWATARYPSVFVLTVNDVVLLYERRVALRVQFCCRTALTAVCKARASYDWVCTEVSCGGRHATAIDLCRRSVTVDMSAAMRIPCDRSRSLQAFCYC